VRLQGSGSVLSVLKKLRRFRMMAPGDLAVEEEEEFNLRVYALLTEKLK